LVAAKLTQAASGYPVTAEACVQTSAWAKCGGENYRETNYFSNTLVFSCQYDPTNAPYSFIQHLKTITAEDWVQNSAWAKCGGENYRETNYFSNTLVFSCKYHLTNAPYPFIQQLQTIYNLSS
jgi:non-ribosomal peptide synthetase component F